MTAEIQVEQLLQAAKAAREQAYAPYSGYKVGAALQTKNGIFAACNVENASYGGTICAERAAVCAAVAWGEREFLALAVVTDGPEPGPPCGLCRQVLAEFAADLPIYLGNLAGKVVELNLATLFPAAFGSGFLEGKKNG